ncbi:histidine phosphatase family protein [Nocardia carnea]|uniref:histidine phosphatase family protein n=1 Tax=Nocardia carnea TaxID=37328 RepID=UPI0024572AEC|nr:histidine phosphatase family protein [Nocardia carnea]
MRSSLILVRHARSVPPTPDGPGDYQRPLTDSGKAQAAGLADDLAAREPRLIVSSPYLRAVQTLEPAARILGMPIRTDPQLQEWDSGIVPGPGYERYYEESWAYPRRVHPGGESLHDLTERAIRTLTGLLADCAGRPALVGSHGTFISRALLGFGCPGINWDFHRAMPMPAIYHLEIGARSVRAAGPGL